MGRINLNVKNNNSNLVPRQNHHPFLLDEETEEDNSLDDQLTSNDEYQEESSQVEEIEESEESESNEINQKKDLANAVNAIYNQKANEIKGEVTKKVFTNPAVIKFLLIAVLLLLVVIFIVYIVAAVSGSSFNTEIITNGYYASRCKEVTVIMTDSNYNYTGTATYDLEDYVAGVVSAEIGGFNNLDLYKEFAIAARSYFFTHDDDCTIESSDRAQVFRDVRSMRTSSASLIYQAVEETAGQVVLKDNTIVSTEYDAFCTVAVDSSYYTLGQMEQKVPRSWADSQSGIRSEWKKGTCAGNHGRGLSQWGSYYLATNEGYNYEQLLKYYLGESAEISKYGFVSSIPGLVIKDTTDATEIHEPLYNYLRTQGHNIDDLNDYIYENVQKNGYQSRAGVVTAAVSLVNYLYDGYHARLPYYWGGSYQHIGVDPDFGGRANTKSDSYGRTWTYSGFDCSGFVSWAIINGGFTTPRLDTASFDSSYSANSCDITNDNCVGQVGDLINSASCHVQMIVAVDESNGIYYVAESTGDYGLITRPWGMHEGNCGNKETKILHMDSLYGG